MTVMENSKGYMLDTNIFGDLADGEFRLEDLPSDGQFWATHVQWVEICKAPDNVRSKFIELILDQNAITSAAFALDVPGAGLNQGEFRQPRRDAKENLDREPTPGQRMIPPAFAWGVPGAGWGEGEWRLDGSAWHAIKKYLDDALEKNWAGQRQRPTEEKKKHMKENNSKDASIAETAMFKGYTLITCDGALAEAAAKHGIIVLNPRFSID